MELLGRGMLLNGLLALFLFGTAAAAEVCDYRPSRLLGEGATAVGIGGMAATGGTGATGTALGFYTLVHSTSGLTMLGSTLAGTSAAGTIGIIGGTGGVVGSAAAFVMSPVVIGTMALGAVGGSAYEGVCFFKIDRVTDHDEVYTIVGNIAANADPNHFRLVEATSLAGRSGPAVIVTNEDGVTTEYAVESLYIADGVLRNRDWFLNTPVGEVAYITGDQP